MLRGGSAVLLLAALCAMLPGAAHAAARGTHRSAPSHDAIMPGIVIVALKGNGTDAGPSRTATAPETLLRNAGMRSARRLFAPVAMRKPGAEVPDLSALGRIYECTLPDGADPVAAAARLSRDPNVDYAEPRYLHRLADTPNDPLLADQNAAFTRLNAFAGWTLGKGSPSVLIATIDGGTYWRHEDLLPNVRINALEDVNQNGIFDAPDNNGVDDDGNGYVDDVVGWNFTNSTNDPSGLTATPQSHAHGTATASHFGAVANNGTGIAGSSWNCALLPVCVASATGDNLIAYGYEGIVYAALRGAKVINCSWGRSGGFSRFEQDVITTVTAGGALVVAAAGNENTNSDALPFYPANYRGVLAVGATESASDARAAFSNYGMNVPVYAPGVHIHSAFVGGGYGDGGNGTSYSSPLVAGLAGILRSVQPALTPGQIAAQIRSTADPIDNVNPSYAGLLGHGRVNFARALSENNVALEVLAASARTPGGRSTFLPGDTVLVRLTLRNALFLTANTIAFTATTSSGFLAPLAVPAPVASLAAGQTVEPEPFQFVVGSVGGASSIVIRMRWTAGGAASGGFALPVMVFPVLPQWAMQQDGYDAGFFSVHAVSPAVAWAGGGDGVGSYPVALRTTDGGETWDDRRGDLAGCDLYCIRALDADRAWAGTGDGRIFATTNGGLQWVQQSYPGRQSPFINGVWMFPDGTGYAQGDPPGDNRFVVLKTTDFGGTWAHLASEPLGTAGEAGWNNSFWWADANHGWFGTNHAKVWRTTDGGASWSSAPSGATNSFGVSFHDASTGYAIHDGGNVSRTTNGGASWTPLSSGTTDIISSVAAVTGTSSAWFATAFAPYRTRNTGGSWSAETLFPFSGSLNHISFADTLSGWVVSSNGEILKYTPPTITDVQDGAPPAVPVSITLQQNYPNPFNGNTRITFTVSGSSRDLTIRVFDVLGREVGTLAHGVHPPGAYAVAFDARDRASGLYLCVLEAAGVDGNAPLRLVRPMVLIR